MTAIAVCGSTAFAVFFLDMDGWIKLHRKFLEWEWYSDVNVKVTMIHFLLNANFKPTRFKGHEIGIGSIVCGIKETSAKIGISEQSFRTALTKLEKSGEINKQTTNKFTVVTICKWDYYQTLLDDENDESNKQVTNKQQTTNKQLTTSEEYKKEINKERKNYSDDEEKKEKKEISSSSHAQSENQDFEFLKADAINENKKSHSENGLAARANIEVSMPNFIKREDVGNWLIVETSTEWKESICREFQCGLKDLPWLFSQYSDELLKQGVEDKDERDIKKHFLSMMRVKRDVWNKNKIDPYKTNPNGISPQVDKLITMLYGE